MSYYDYNYDQRYSNSDDYYDYSYNYPTTDYQYAQQNNRRTASSSSDLVAAASGGGDCCPHVVDPTFFTLTLAVCIIEVKIKMLARLDWYLYGVSFRVRMTPNEL